MTTTTDFNEALLEKIRSYMRGNGIPPISHLPIRAGIALSGGPDSMALLHIARRLEWETIALHCNFGLRGEESERDEAFVTDACERLGVKLLKTRFDVAGRIGKTGESLEMACRELRYDWFIRVAKKERLTMIALGHHGDDNVETFLLNILRGCGIGGAKGIPPTRGIFVRPMLCLTRREILEYLRLNGIRYVTDSSNHSNDFRRNKLRNIILPSIESLFPGGIRKIDASIRNLSDDNKLFRSLVEEKRRKYTDTDGRVEVRRLFKEETEPVTLLYHILDGDLSHPLIEKMRNAIESSGKFYTGRSGRKYLLDRGTLLTVDDSGGNDTGFISHLRIDKQKLAENPIVITLPAAGIEIHVRLIPRREFSPRRNPDFAWFDSALLDAPDDLHLHHPFKGERMTPFGMNGTTLLSDIFSDHKLSIIDKKNQLVLSSGPRTLWIPGLKNSALFPVLPSTENILEFHMVKTDNNS